MGSSYSSLLIDECACYFLCPIPSNDGPNPGGHPGAPLGDLPENCAAMVLAHLDPLDICNLARLNRSFRSASWADFVWESKLPNNCAALAARVLGESHGRDAVSKMCKRQIFSLLCQAHTFDGGTKRAWIDKKTGGVCLSVSAKGLGITGVDDRRYWNHIPTEESRFGSVAYLSQTWWLEVRGEVEFPLPEGRYGLYFRVQLGRSERSFGRRRCNTEHVHGWDVKPVRFQMWASDGHQSSSNCFFKETARWTFYHVGDFVVRSDRCVSLKFSLTQIDCTHTKGGLSVDSVFVVPSASSF